MREAQLDASSTLQREPPPLCVIHFAACAVWLLRLCALGVRPMGAHTAALCGGAGAKRKDKWDIFKRIEDARVDASPAVPAVAGAADARGCAREQQAAEVDSLQDEVALLKGKLASAKRLASGRGWAGVIRARRLRGGTHALGNCMRLGLCWQFGGRVPTEARADAEAHGAAAAAAPLTPPGPWTRARMRAYSSTHGHAAPLLTRTRARNTRGAAQERQEAEDKMARMTLELRETRDALAASHRASNDVVTPTWELKAASTDPTAT